MARSQVVKPVKTLWRLLLQKRLLYCILTILWIKLMTYLCIVYTTEWTFTTNTPIKIYIFLDGRPLLRGNHTFKIPQKSNGLTYGLCGSMLKNLMSNRCNVNSWNLLLGQEYRFCWKHHYRVICKLNVFFNEPQVFVRERERWDILAGI